ncbi:MAG TPA: hypothetical protein VLV78_22355 [Thermoanaerobaculia bacterium]|nr:hypothetical protein [Thermoanaerobaculia bacterium]
MKRMMAISLCLLFLAGCGAKGGAKVDDLQKANEDLKARVKALEDDLLQADKKLIQHDQALQAMAERLRDMENAVNKMQLGPAR